MKPNEIGYDPGGMLVGTLGHAEVEFLGALIIRWHHFHGHAEWQPVSRRDLIKLFEVDEVARSWTKNPFWKPDPYEFCEQGFIEGWVAESDVKGTLTEKFFTGIQKRIDNDEKNALRK